MTVTIADSGRQSLVRVLGSRLAHPVIALLAAAGATFFAEEIFTWPRNRIIDYESFPDFLYGHRYWSKLIYVGLCLIVAVVSRVAPKQRDRVNLVLGVVLWSWMLGWPVVACLVVAVALLHYVIAKRGSYIAMAITAVLMIAIGRGVARATGTVTHLVATIPPFFTLSHPAPWSDIAKLELLFLLCLKPVILAFDWLGIRKSQRSIERSLTYCLGVTFPLVFYVSYHSIYSQTPREQSDRDAARLLYWFALKMAALAGLLWLAYNVIPDRTQLYRLPAYWRLLVFVQPALLMIIVPFARFDLGHGLACLAGYNAPDSGNLPLIRPTPLQRYLRQNINEIDFLRRISIYPTVRRFRGSFFMAVVASMSAMWLLHIVWMFLLQESPARALVLAFPTQTISLLFIAGPLENAYQDSKPWLRGVIGAVYIGLSTFFIFMFPIYPVYYGIELFSGPNQAPFPANQCLAVAALTGTQCDVTKGFLPTALWFLLPIVVFFAFTYTVVGLVKLFPALRHADANPKGSPRTLSL